MSYEIIIPEPIEKEINKRFDKELIKRFHKKMQKICVAPDVYRKPLRAPLRGIWETRFEVRYRILYTIDYKNKLVVVIGIKHKDEMAKCFPFPLQSRSTF